MVQQQFQLSRKDEFIQAFVKQAIAKVVQPLEDLWEKEEDLITEKGELLPELRDLTPLEPEYLPETLPEPEFRRARYGDWHTPSRQRDEW